MHDDSGYRPWKTAITDTREDILIRGYRLDDLVERSDFVSMVALVLNGELPTRAQTRMLNAIFVAIVDHGIVPSSSVTRIVASCGVPIQSAIAAGILTLGDDHGGAAEQLAAILEHTVANRRTNLDSEARTIVADHRKRRARVPGYGHGLHPDGDPRAVQLFRIGRELGVCGPHTDLAMHIDNELERQLGRRIAINTDGAIAALACDMGFSWGVMRPLIIISRSVGLAAHAWEQMTSGAGWRLAARADDIVYAGPSPRPVPDSIGS